MILTSSSERLWPKLNRLMLPLKPTVLLSRLVLDPMPLSLVRGSDHSDRRDKSAVSWRRDKPAGYDSRSGADGAVLASSQKQ